MNPQQKQILVPVLIVAVIIVAVSFIMMLVKGDSPKSEPSPSTSTTPAPEMKTIPGKKEYGKVPLTSEGMVLERPNSTGPEYKNVGDDLLVWDVKVGEGEDTLQVGDVVDCHYSGWLDSGKQFDSSLRRNAPARFALRIPDGSPEGGVIVGWVKGLQGMKPGGIRRLYIPYPLAYGEQDKGDIPPKSNLLFEVKLLRFQR